MQDIFVSTLLECLDSWEKAFPRCKLLKHVSELSTSSNAKQQPVVIWLHLHAQLNVAETMVAIFKQQPLAKVVILDNDPSHTQSLQALSAGAMGYVHAYSAPKLLTEVKAVISHGGIWLGQQLLQRIIETSVKLTGSNPEYVDGLLKQLTKREQQVAQEAAKGLSNKEIARILNITERTVKAHLAATFERLHVKDRLQLALMLNRQPRAEPIPEAVVMPAPTPITAKRKAAPKKTVKPARRIATAKLA